MQANIDDIRRHLQRRSESGELVETEGGVVLAQEAIDGGLMPGGIAQLEGVTMLSREDAQESRQTLQIAGPVWWQLKQDGSQLLAQDLQTLQEAGERILRIRELLQVGQIAAGFGGETEITRRLPAPVAQSIRRREPVETCVDLDGRKPLCVGRQHSRRRLVRGIERPAPVRVGPARRADVYRVARSSPPDGRRIARSIHCHYIRASDGSEWSFGWSI